MDLKLSEKTFPSPLGFFFQVFRGSDAVHPSGHMRAGHANVIMRVCLGVCVRSVSSAGIETVKNTFYKVS